jgi:hypothetical protein
MLSTYIRAIPKEEFSMRTVVRRLLEELEVIVYVLELEDVDRER